MIGFTCFLLRSSGVIVTMPRKIFSGPPSQYSIMLPEGQPEVPLAQRPNHPIQAISPAYFETMGIALLRGRTFEQRDQEETALFVSQFQREFQHRSSEVSATVDRLAVSEHARSMAFELARRTWIVMLMVPV